MTVTNGKKVSIEYTLSIEDDQVVDSNVGEEPLTYEHGSNQIIPGLESAIEGMQAGESRNVTISPEDAYGHVIQDAIIEVKREQMAPDAWKVGAQIQAQGPGGEILVGRVTEVMEDRAKVDFNHPMAGKTLFFAVKVVEIQ